jgi:hypothetical protein
MAANEVRYWFDRHTTLRVYEVTVLRETLDQYEVRLAGGRGFVRRTDCFPTSAAAATAARGYIGEKRKLLDEAEEALG